MLNVIPIPAFEDNYIWLIQNIRNNHAVVVDPGDAAPVIETLQRKNLTLEAIFVTHHHHDHTGGISDLLVSSQIAKTAQLEVYGPSSSKIPSITYPVKQDSCVYLNNLETDFEVLEVPGHTLDHIAFYTKKRLFCGDTLFGAGCGRLFEGTPQQMVNSLNKLAQLPSDTEIYCAHEYTLANLKFAEFVEPSNKDIQKRIIASNQLLTARKCTLPSSLSLELATNPFLRCHFDSIKNSATQSTGQPLDAYNEVFAAIRRMKDQFVVSS
ncbi:MAG: hydroxyacylglutathione hydrolase [Pseudomonadota bacterium]